jgi:hypothetical protein
LLKALIVLCCFITVQVLSFEPAYGKNCAALTKDLLRLRQEYKLQASNKNDPSKRAEFKKLSEILDKIIDIKSEMRKQNCKIPDRK